MLQVSVVAGNRILLPLKPGARSARHAGTLALWPAIARNAATGALGATLVAEPEASRIASIVPLHHRVALDPKCADVVSLRVL